MIQRRHVLEIFSDDLLFELEQHVIHMPEQRKLFDQVREFPQFISLPGNLEDAARGALQGAKQIEFDLVNDEVLYHFK